MTYKTELCDYDSISKAEILARALDVDITSYKFISELWKPEYGYSMVDFEGDKIQIVVSNEMTKESWDKEVLDMILRRIYDEILVRREKRKLEKLISATGVKAAKSFFVTIGLDDKQFTKQNERERILAILSRLTNIKDINVDKYVVEKHRRADNGSIYIHRHIHCKITSDFRKSKIIQYVFQKLNTKANAYVSQKNFIDVKPWIEDIHDEYLDGNKESKKVECVEMDRKWREELNL